MSSFGQTQTVGPVQDTTSTLLNERVSDLTISPLQSSVPTTKKKIKLFLKKENCYKLLFFVLGFLFLCFAIQLFFFPSLLNNIFQKHIKSALIFDKKKPHDHWYSINLFFFLLTQ